MREEKKYFEFWSFPTVVENEISSRVIQISKELKVNITYFTVQFEPQFMVWVVRAFYEENHE